MARKKPSAHVADESADALLNVYLEEYRQTRAEINLKQRHIHAIANFALIVIAAGTGAVTSSDSLGSLQLYVMLFAPLVLGLLGLLFAYEGELMAVASGYINVSIRGRIATLVDVNREDVIPWEEFKHAHSPPLWLVYDLARWLTFVVPSFMFIGGYMAYAPQAGIVGALPLLTAGSVLNVLLIGLFVHRLVYKARVLFRNDPE